MSEEENTKKEKKSKGENQMAKERFENMIEDDTTEEEIEDKITRVGYIEMKKQHSKKGKKF